MQHGSVSGLAPTDAATKDGGSSWLVGDCGVKRKQNAAVWNTEATDGYYCGIMVELSLDSLLQNDESFANHKSFFRPNASCALSPGIHVGQDRLWN